MNIADHLERDRWPVYFLELAGGSLKAAYYLRPGAFVPHTVAVRPRREPAAWETVRELLEEPGA